MGIYRDIKKVCGFYISSTHLITMILPYIKKQLELHEIIETVSEYNLTETVKKILSKIIMKEEEKQKILKINWENTRIHKYINMEKFIRRKMEINNKITIFITGNKDYIDKANKIIRKVFNKYFYKMPNKKLTIIDCYEVTEFNDNIRDVLDEHEFILNTSGIHKVEEVFEYYKRNLANE